MANLDYLVKALEIVKEAHVAKQEMSKQTMYSGHSHIAGTGIVKVEGKDRVKDWEEPTRLKQLIGVKENQVKEEINAQINQTEDSVVTEELSMKNKIYQILDIYQSKDASSIGGGLIENVTESAWRDEDVAAATMQKGMRDTTLKDMLPILDGRTVNSLRKAVDKWYNENNRKIVVKQKMDILIGLVQEIESEPRLVEELGWSVKEEINAKEDTIRLLNELASNPKNAGLNARLNKIIELIKDC
jgi:hypothetical protein